jgi:mitochondrial import inner membrane translocase subunit TIM54
VARARHTSAIPLVPDSPMSSANGEPIAKPEPVVTSKPPVNSGLRTVLRYTGIPPSWLEKKPKLPSRNWMIFLGVTSSVVGYYIYDRRECRRIQQVYIDKVKDLSEDKLDPMDVTRKVTIYGARWPGDEDYQQAMKYFRKYVKVRPNIILPLCSIGLTPRPACPRGRRC